jgi:hypothetical protein
MDSIISTIVEDDRPAFLKGIILGVAMRKAADALEGKALNMCNWEALVEDRCRY